MIRENKNIHSLHPCTFNVILNVSRWVIYLDINRQIAFNPEKVASKMTYYTVIYTKKDKSHNQKIYCKGGVCGEHSSEIRRVDSF